ncbi:unnamed protein product, partial [Discosporangium mesarthrocarpum]
MSRRPIRWVLCGVTSTGREEVGCWWTTCTTPSALVRSGLVKDGTGVNPHPAENTPKPPRAQDKQFITKYMFLAPVGWPRKTRIGVYLACRKFCAGEEGRQNHKMGTPIMKPATVHGERYKFMIEKAIPVIKARMPRPLGHKIFVQQDGPKPRTGKGVMEAIQDAAGDEIILETQPANSPDLNVNDLTFFHSIQQLKEDVGVTDGKELVEGTMEASEVYPLLTLERVWQGHFAVYGGDMGCKGDISYNMPHLGKENLAKAGNLPKNAR